MIPEPRLRGDGPILYTHHWVLPNRTPPTRGWTSHISMTIEIQLQNPAYAGMDLDNSLMLHHLATEPRLRGDGPGHSARRDRRSARTPPTRGWTQR